MWVEGSPGGGGRSAPLGHHVPQQALSHIADSHHKHRALRSCEELGGQERYTLTDSGHRQCRVLAACGCISAHGNGERRARAVVVDGGARDTMPRVRGVNLPKAGPEGLGGGAARRGRGRASVGHGPWRWGGRRACSGRGGGGRGGMGGGGGRGGWGGAARARAREAAAAVGAAAGRVAVALTVDEAIGGALGAPRSRAPRGRAPGAAVPRAAARRLGARAGAVGDRPHAVGLAGVGLNDRRAGGRLRPFAGAFRRRGGGGPGGAGAAGPRGHADLLRGLQVPGVLLQGGLGLLGHAGGGLLFGRAVVGVQDLVVVHDDLQVAPVEQLLQEVVLLLCHLRSLLLRVVVLHVRAVVDG